MLARRALPAFFLVTLALSVSAATTKVARYAYTANHFTVLPYSVDPATGHLRFAPAQTLSGPPCDGSGSGTVTAPSQKFLYLVASCGQILAETINADGTLTPISGSPFPVGTSLYQIVFTPSGKFAYVTDFSNYPQLTIIPVAVNTKSGALTQLSGSVSYSGATQTPIMLMDTVGKFLFVLDANAGVYVYAINALTGALTVVTGSPFSTGGSNATSFAEFPGGAFLFATNYATNGSVSVLKINRTTGVLTPAKGSPFTTPGSPYSVAVDPARHFVYVGYDGFNSNISVFRVKTGGVLSEVPGSPFQTLGTTDSIYLITDPSGHFLYSRTNSGNLGDTWEQVLSINPTTGALSPVQTVALPFTTPLAFVTGTTPVSFAPTYAYAANSPVATSVPDGIAEFSINPTTGALSPLDSVADNNGPQHLIASPAGNFVYAADTVAVNGYGVQGNGLLSPVTTLAVSATAIMEDQFLEPNDSDFYTANGGGASDWFLNLSTGQIEGHNGDWTFTGPVVAMTTGSGSFYDDFVLTSDATLWEIVPGSNTGAITGSFPVGNSPSAVALDGGGRFVYVANSADNTVSGFATYGDSLQQLNSGIPFATGTTPSAIVGDPLGFYLYVANSGSHDLWTYSIDPTNGNLAQVGSPVAVGNGPVSLNIDNSGKFLYCANSGDGTISTFTIAANGTLTPAGTYVVDSTITTPAPTSIVSVGTHK
jgi:6-phosphogluconolactonase